MSNPIVNMGDRVGANRIKPGSTRNPGGRPSFTKYAKEAGYDPKKLCATLIVKAVEWMNSGHPKLAPYAHQWLSDHLYGKPKEHFHVEMDSAGVALIVAAGMTPVERRKALAEIDADPDEPESDGADEG